MKRIKGNTKLIVGLVLGIFISAVTSYAVAETLIKSADVSYVDNAKLGATNVQAAIDGTCTKFSNDLATLLDKMYPIGSIYISTTLSTPAQVGSAIGGTWESYGKGQTLVGIDTSQTEFSTVGKTGGNKSNSYTPSGSIGSTGLTINQIPSHTHNIEHTHTTAASSITNGTAAATTSTWMIRAAHSGNNDDYKGLNTSISTAAYSKGNYSPGTNLFWDVVYSNTHSHTVTGTIPSLSTDSISTKNSGAAGKGTTSDGHTHTFTGTATTLNNLQPYITVYMYRRTK